MLNLRVEVIPKVFAAIRVQGLDAYLVFRDAGELVAPFKGYLGAGFDGVFHFVFWGGFHSYFLKAFCL